MRPYRREKIENLIQHELGSILAREVEFSETSLVTVNWVEATSDLREAKVGIGVIPDDKAERTLVILTKLRGFIQKLLTRKLNIKPMPRIKFVIDHGSKTAVRIGKLLREADKA